METLEYLKTLGSGTFGDVYLCRKKNGETVAIKRFFIPRGNANIGIINLKELNVMKMAENHPNLMSMTNLWLGHKPFKDKLNQLKSEEDRNAMRTDKMYIGMKAADGTILSLIENKELFPKVTVEQKIYICLQILNGVLFLHQNNIVHRDLKTNNILYFATPQAIEDGEWPKVKVSDYGTSRPIRIGDVNTRRFGNAYYNAPEHFFVRNKYDKKVDVWALAICFIDIFTGIFVFSTDALPPVSNTIDIIKERGWRSKDEKSIDRAETFRRLLKVISLVGVPDEEIYNRILGNHLEHFPYERMLEEEVEVRGIDAFFEGESIEKHLGDYKPLIVDLMKKMLEVDAEKRISVEEAMQHPLFHPSVIPWPTVHVVPVVEHRLGNPHWMKGNGLNVFKAILNDFNTDLDTCRSTKMIFLGLDIYHRVCQYLSSNPKNKETKYLINKIGSVQVAASCIYIAFKYYTDWESLPFPKLFKCYDGVDDKKSLVQAVEKTVLNIIGYQITRPLIFDYVVKKGVLGKLFYYLIEECGYYDYTPSEVAKILEIDNE